jgi:hypothetical protein
LIVSISKQNEGFFAQYSSEKITQEKQENKNNIFKQMSLQYWFWVMSKHLPDMLISIVFEYIKMLPNDWIVMTLQQPLFLMCCVEDVRLTYKKFRSRNVSFCLFMDDIGIHLCSDYLSHVFKNTKEFMNCLDKKFVTIPHSTKECEEFYLYSKILLSSSIFTFVKKTKKEFKSKNDTFVNLQKPMFRKRHVKFLQKTMIAQS